MANLTAGQAFPDFDLPADDGGRVASGQLRGRPFVAFFYPKDDTSGCTLEALDFTALAPDFAAAGVPVYGVSPDPVDKHCRFRDKHGLAVPLLADTERTLLEAAGVWVQKSMYGKTYMGVERTTVLVDGEGVVRRVWPKVKVDGHAREVLDEARKLAGAAA
ncbi:peroxiredoxin [Aureimonas flava]|uniref:thioredoxin-dependent peroxiredoxin n=1 Tax=Aureimonas flava TaxID=2320271 RepID=A0A3A1WSM9_9HYPH|nr:peroxiredoxin [Aureimonas flava]RIY03735.1 peroxiredoxin [Aureimonas flava]